MKNKTATIFLFWSLMCCTMPLRAELLDMEDAQMEEVTAQAGISISLNNATFYDEYGRIEVRDSANTGTLAFEDVVVDNGNGWGYSFSTSKPLLIDLVNYNAGTAIYNIFTGSHYHLADEENVALNVYAESWSQNIQFTANHLLINNQDMGKLQIGPISMPTYQFMLTPPDSDGLFSGEESGLYFRYLFQSTIGNAGLTYNTQNQALMFQNVRFARSFTGTVTTPSAWAASGSFLMGKYDTVSGEDSFASINVIKENGTLKLEAEIPMRGSIRIDKTQFDTRNFGPVAIDTIKVNRLSLQLTP